jgi:hypothetical protein
MAGLCRRELVELRRTDTVCHGKQGLGLGTQGHFEFIDRAPARGRLIGKSAILARPFEEDWLEADVTAEANCPGQPTAINAQVEHAVVDMDTTGPKPGSGAATPQEE